MKPIYKTFEELPLFLSVKELAAVMGISVPVAYEVVHREDFPAIRVGDSKKRIVIPRDRFAEWMNQKGGIDN